MMPGSSAGLKPPVQLEGSGFAQIKSHLQQLWSNQGDNAVLQRLWATKFYIC